MSYTVNPSASNAQYETFAGVAMNDPVNYSSAPVLPDPTVTAQYHYVPWQNEILNLIAKQTDGPVAFQVVNETGGNLAAGTVVSITGYSSLNDRFTIVKADNDDASLPARAVLTQAINDTENGLAWRHADLTAQNTSGATVGDPVYLDTTAGGWTLTKPTTVTRYVQILGFVHTVDASAGVIRFRIGMPGDIERISESMLPSSVPTISGLSDNAVIRADGASDLQNSGLRIDDSNNLYGINNLTSDRKGTINDAQYSDGDFQVKGQFVSHAFFVDVDTGRSHFAYNTTPTGTRTVNINGDLGATTIEGTIIQAVNTGGSPYIKTETDTTVGQDPYILWNIQSTRQYALGIDNSDSDKLKLTTHATAANPSAGTTVWEVGTSGNSVFYQTVKVTDSGTNFDTLVVNFSDGTPRVTAGTFETSTGYGVIHMGNVTPSISNYALASNGSDLILNSTGAVRFAVSGGEGMRVSATEVIINESSVTHDFRIEGTSLTHGFFYDASTGRVHIGYNTTPTGTETVNLAGTMQLTPSANNYDTLIVNHSDGTARVRIGNLEGGNTYGSIHLSSDTPAFTNYALARTAGGNLLVNAPPSKAIQFNVNNVAEMYLSSRGNLLLGTNTDATAGDGQIMIFADNAADPTLGTNTASTYAKDVAGTVEMFVIDEALNVTQTSPHDDEGYWYYHSRNLKTGREIKVHLEKFFKWAIEKFPEAAEFYEENFEHDPKQYKKQTKRKAVA